MTRRQTANDRARHRELQVDAAEDFIERARLTPSHLTILSLWELEVGSLYDVSVTNGISFRGTLTGVSIAGAFFDNCGKSILVPPPATIR